MARPPVREVLFLAVARIITQDDSIVVRVRWEGGEVDRREWGGWSLPKRHMALAVRLRDAINTQKVLRNPKIAKDVHGKTFILAFNPISGRRMNADLARLGF